MRRLVALLAVFGYANLSFAQAPGACPLTGATHASGAVSEHATDPHSGHHAPAATDGETVDTTPDADGAHPGCVMAGPCGLTVDVGHVAASSVSVAHNESVVGLSDLLPPSLTTAPDIPPPRA